MNSTETNFQGAFPDGELDFSRIFSTEDHLQFDFTNSDQFPGENYGGQQFTTNHFLINPELTNVNENLFYSLNIPDIQLQENSSCSNSNSGGSVFAPNSDQPYGLFSDSMSMDFCIVDEKNSNLFFPPEISMAEAVSVTETISHSGDYSLPPPPKEQLKRKLDIPELQVNPPDNATKKKTRVTKDEMKSGKKATKNSSAKNKNKELEEINGGEEGQSRSSSSSSEEDNIDDTKEALNSSGKARASRGSATDPQSLYARKRRERINERLRILQNLVPNGTKVDISTMLEEAVQYVKFLQLQIKLLSSDDMWMYAPIAYNGMDIGLNHNISLLL